MAQLTKNQLAIVVKILFFASEGEGCTVHCTLATFIIYSTSCRPRLDSAHGWFRTLHFPLGLDLRSLGYICASLAANNFLIVF